MTNILCKLFGHKMIYSKTSIGSIKYYRNCKRCGMLQEYRESNGRLDCGWYSLVQYTEKGVKDLLKQLKER